MVSDINFLLVGNSRLHWAKYSKNQSKFFHTKKEQKVPKNIDLDQLIWASVGKLPNFLLKKENEIKTKIFIYQIFLIILELIELLLVLQLLKLLKTL